MSYLITMGLSVSLVTKKVKPLSVGYFVTKGCYEINTNRDVSVGG